MQRQLFLKGCGKKDEGKTYFICSHHKMHRVAKKTIVKRNGKNAKDCTVTDTFLVPTGEGVKASSQPTMPSKGLGYNRLYNRMVSDIKQNISHLNTTKDNDNLVDVATENTTILLDICAENDQLVAECERLREENESLKKKQKDLLEKGPLHWKQNNNGHKQ